MACACHLLRLYGSLFARSASAAILADATVKGEQGTATNEAKSTAIDGERLLPTRSSFLSPIRLLPRRRGAFFSMTLGKAVVRFARSTCSQTVEPVERWVLGKEGCYGVFFREKVEED